MPINEKGTVYMTRTDLEKQLERAEKRLIETTIEWSFYVKRIDHVGHRIDRNSHKSGDLVDNLLDDLTIHRKKRDEVQQRMHNLVSKINLLDRRIAMHED
jgi:hypothetical protein